MIGTLIFLPPLLNESFLPKLSASTSNDTVTNQTAALAVGQADAMHYGTKPGHFETSEIHFPTSEGVSEVSERANE